jgi:tetratricopeptide (TPR) repeat protein
MTQSDLAGADFSKGFISLLETGRTRASLRAAGILAARLGTSAPELLATSLDGGAELDLLILRAEQQLSAGHFNDALEFVARALPLAKGDLRARALRTQGRALLESGRAREGLTVLEEAGRAFEALGEREMVVRTAFDRATAHAHLDEPGNALVSALECEAALRAGTLVDRTLELQVRSLLAAAFTRAGDLESADLQARLALVLAEDVVDAEALGTLYSTISLGRQRQHDFSGAVGYARKSLALFEGLGRERAVGQMWHNLAAIYLEQRDYRRAGDAIERAERVAREAKAPSLEARLLGLRAELAAAQRRSAEAQQFAAAAIAHPAASAQTRGRSLLVQARLLAQGKSAGRRWRETFEAAITALSSEPPRIRAEAHEAYAALLAERADWKLAYEQTQLALRFLRPKLR